MHSLLGALLTKLLPLTVQEALEQMLFLALCSKLCKWFGQSRVQTRSEKRAIEFKSSVIHTVIAP